MSSERKGRARKSRKISGPPKHKLETEVKTREELAKFNSILQGIIESTSASIFSVDAKYRYLNFNTNHSKIMNAIYGIKIEIGKSLLEYMTVKEDRKKAKKNLDRALGGEQFVEESFSGDELKSRRYFQVFHGPIKTATGKITGVVVWALDITDRKRSEEALAESEERYRQLVNLSPDAIYVHSEGKIVFANPASFKLIRAKKESDLIGKNAMDFVHPDYYRAAEERIRSAMRLNIAAPLLEERFIRVDGTPIDVEVIAKPLKYLGKPAMQVMARDITERKISEQRLKRQLTFAQAFNRISEAMAKYDTSDQILERTNQIIGETLGVDRALIYDIVIDSNQAIALCEWLNPNGESITPTKGTYNLDLFKDGSGYMFKSHHYLESHKTNITKHFLKDGSAKLLHEAMQIQSLLWYPFDFRSNHYYVLVFNQVTRLREWQKDEIEFIDSAAHQITFALQKIRFLCERKLAESSLYESETNLRTLIETLPDAVFFKDGEGRWITINSAARKLFRLVGKEYVGKTDSELALVVPELKDVFEYCTISDEATWKSNQLTRGEEYVKDEHGVLHFFDTIKVPLFNENGSRKGLVIIGRDITEHKKVGEALKESEERYRSLFTTMEEGVAINQLLFDEKGDVIDYLVVDINPSFLKNSPYQTKQIVGKKATELYSMSSEYICNWWKEHLNKNETVHSEYYHERNNRWYSVTTTIPEGNRFATIFVDITERKRADNAILESERRFKDLANLLPQTVFEADKNGVITFANDAALTTFGYTSDDVSKGLNMVNMIAEKDKSRAFDNMNRILQHQVTGSNEYEMCRKDGSTFPALVFNSPIIYFGKSVGFRGSIADISYQKHAEKELRKLSEAVSQSPASIMITDLNGAIEYVNKTFEENTGYTLSEVYQKNPRFLQSGYTPKTEYNELWTTILSGKTWRGELSNKKKNGELYWEDALISVVKDTNGKPINYLAVKQDITEKKKMIRDLIEAKEEAENANKLKTEFLAQMSHEIRSPLNVVMNVSSIIRDEFSDQLTEQQSRFFDGIEFAGKRIIRTINLILDISELQVGTYKPELERIDLVEMFKDIQKEYSKLAFEKGLRFNVICNTASIFLVADPYSVNQIFVNLIDNAIKYTNEGSVTIIVNKDMEERISVVIKDTGIGISHDYMKIIFEPFTQEERGYSRRFEGNGLGLALVKRYCDLNKAEISVVSEKEKGSEFIVTFP